MGTASAIDSSNGYLGTATVDANRQSTRYLVVYVCHSCDGHVLVEGMHAVNEIMLFVLPNVGSCWISPASCSSERNLCRGRQGVVNAISEIQLVRLKADSCKQNTDRVLDDVSWIPSENVSGEFV